MVNTKNRLERKHLARLLVIDSNSIMNRAFYANPDFTTSTGLHTGAVYGFMNMLLRIREDIRPGLHSRGL